MNCNNSCLIVEQEIGVAKSESACLLPGPFLQAGNVEVVIDIHSPVVKVSQQSIILPIAAISYSVQPRTHCEQRELLSDGIGWIHLEQLSKYQNPERSELCCSCANIIKHIYLGTGIVIKLLKCRSHAQNHWFPWSQVLWVGYGGQT